MKNVEIPIGNSIEDRTSHFILVQSEHLFEFIALLFGLIETYLAGKMFGKQKFNYVNESKINYQCYCVLHKRSCFMQMSHLSMCYIGAAYTQFLQFLWNLQALNVQTYLLIGLKICT